MHSVETRAWPGDHPCERRWRLRRQNVPHDSYHRRCLPRVRLAYQSRLRGGGQIRGSTMGAGGGKNRVFEASSSQSSTVQIDGNTQKFPRSLLTFVGGPSQQHPALDHAQGSEPLFAWRELGLLELLVSTTPLPPRKTSLGGNHDTRNCVSCRVSPASLARPVPAGTATRFGALRP